jgi:hypothetical protein
VSAQCHAVEEHAVENPAFEDPAFEDPAYEDTTLEDTAFEETAEWLAGEFSGRLPAPLVAGVVHATRADLDGRIAAEDLGEMLYRIARARLTRMVGDRIPHSR